MPVFKFKEFPPKELAKILSEAGIPFNFVQLKDENGDFFWLWRCPDNIVERIEADKKAIFYGLNFQLDYSENPRGYLIESFEDNQSNKYSDFEKFVYFQPYYKYSGRHDPNTSTQNEETKINSLKNYEYQALVLKYIEILTIYIKKLKQQDIQEEVKRDKQKKMIDNQEPTTKKLIAMNSALKKLTGLSIDGNRINQQVYYNSIKKPINSYKLFKDCLRYQQQDYKEINDNYDKMSEIIEDYRSKIDACLNILENKTDVLQETRDSILMEFAKTALTLGMIHIYRLCKTHLLGLERTESMQHYSMFKKEFEDLEKKYTPTPKNE